MSLLAAAACLSACWAGSGSESDPSDAGAEELVSKVMRHVLTTVPLQVGGEVEVDGKLDEWFWSSATSVPLKFETYPALLKKAPVRTEALFLRVEDAIVVGFRAYDPDPGKIQAPLRDRDGIERDDYVGISFDPEGKMVRTYEFYVSASGVQADWLRNRVEDKRARDWDADWEGAALVTTNGYTAELRIPLSEIDIPVDMDVKRLMTFKRHYPRDVRHHLAAFSIIEADPFGDHRLDEKFKLIPTVTYVPQWNRDPTESSDWEWEDSFEIGLDLEYRLTTSLGLSATINPNFLEVEGDLTESSINDPFTRLDPEKRPFFTTGIDVFGTPFDTVYTRNIEDPRAGLRLGGTVGDVATGNFLTDDRELSVIVPGNLGSKRVTLEETESLSGAFRYRYDIRRGLSAGAIATVRGDGEDYHNYVGGADIYAKLGQYDTLRAQWLYSDSEYSADFAEDLYDDDLGPADPADDTGVPGETGLREEVLRVRPGYGYGDDAWQVLYKHKQRGGYLTARYQDVGEEFRADLGYLPRVDYRSGMVSGGLDHYFKSEKRGVSRIRLSGNLLRMESQAGESINDSRELWLNYWGLLQSWIRVGFRDRDRVARRVLQNTLDIEGNGPEFNEQQWILRYESALWRNARLILAGRFGDQIDTDNYRLGDLIEVEPELIVNVSKRYELALQSTYRQLDVPEGRVFAENYLRLNLTYQLDRGSFVRFTLIDDYLKREPDQYLYEEVESLERDTSMELLFAWKPSQRNVFLIGVKGNAIDRDELSRPAFDETVVYVKFTKPFSM